MKNSVGECILITGPIAVCCGLQWSELLKFAQFSCYHGHLSGLPVQAAELSIKAVKKVVIYIHQG